MKFVVLIIFNFFLTDTCCFIFVTDPEEQGHAPEPAAPKSATPEPAAPQRAALGSPVGPGTPARPLSPC